MFHDNYTVAFLLNCFSYSSFVRILLLLVMNSQSSYFFISLLLFQIDEWLEYAPILSSGPAFENACKYIDEYLEKRTFLVGYSLSIADIAIWAGLAGKDF